MSSDQLRAPVARFAKVMEARLRGNDWKGGWDHLTTLDLLGRLLFEMAELVVELQAGNHLGAQHETADAANYLMMLHDRLDRADMAIEDVGPSQADIDREYECHLKRQDEEVADDDE